MKRNRRGLIVFVLIAAIFVYLAITKDVFSQGAPAIQTSTSTVFKLCVRDKYGSLGQYNVKFLLTAPDGKVYPAVKKGKSDEVTCAFYFPGGIGDDFSGMPYQKSGKYTWKGVINGRVIEHGQSFSILDSIFVEKEGATQKCYNFL